MYCKKCGKEIKDGNTFCTNCGESININENNSKKEPLKIKFTHLLVSLVILFSIIICLFIVTKQNTNKDNISEKKDITYTIDEPKTITENKIEKLNYNVEIKYNSDMEVTETWKIDIKEANTLFKTFNLDSNKYQGISNVKVIEILSNGEKKVFKQIDTEMYHVTKDCYYALKNSNNQFEIAWGVDANDEARVFQISYTVNEALKIYNDCAELYWTFLGNEFAIPVNYIQGKITSNISDIINAWGHSNNQINVDKNKNYITFNSNDFIKGNYLDLRIILDNKNFNKDKQINKNMFDSILKEEQIDNKNTNNDNNSLGLASDVLKVFADQTQYKEIRTPFVLYNNILCRVIYDNSSDYGVQIISDSMVDTITIATKELDETVNRYNNAIDILNNKAKSYLDDTGIAISARCIGTNPANPIDNNNYYHGTKGCFEKYNLNGKLKDNDENYLTDTDQLTALNIISANGVSCWLASREISEQDASFAYANLYCTSGRERGYNTPPVVSKNIFTISSEPIGIITMDEEKGFRPIFVLSPNAKVISGSGTKDNPYKLGI